VTYAQNAVRGWNPVKRVTWAWTGAERLWVAFWLYWTLGSSLLILGVEYIPESTPPFLRILILLLYVAYHVWAGVAVWRCAKNSKSRWAILARALIALTVIAVVATIYDEVRGA
jgi:hypothetical protein